ncbi:hypothetical protein EVAR_93220_1 [Eumeta japonica]|uniref:Uncharacterized protein n=1 Tax=Eumeta variegata TaxID=151549 RepID=A0A4C1TXL9_EUMVA|nr:hypothetical protein EVAR_93220_1 [Eumeta japonica]
MGVGRTSNDLTPGALIAHPCHPEETIRKEILFKITLGPLKPVLVYEVTRARRKGRTIRIFQDLRKISPRDPNVYPCFQHHTIPMEHIAVLKNVQHILDFGGVTGAVGASGLLLAFRCYLQSSDLSQPYPVTKYAEMNPLLPPIGQLLKFYGRRHRNVDYRQLAAPPPAAPPLPVPELERQLTLMNRFWIVPINKISTLSRGLGSSLSAG